MVPKVRAPAMTSFCSAAGLVGVLWLVSGSLATFGRERGEARDLSAVISSPSVLRRMSLSGLDIEGGVRRGVVCRSSGIGRNARSRLTSKQKRNIKHPDNILRNQAAETAHLGNRIGLEKKRAMRTNFCELCATMYGDMTFHHLIPRATHSKRWCFLRFSKGERSSGVCLCRECHDQVHRKIDEKTLALEYNTLESLQTHPDLQSFVSEKAPWTWLVSPSRGARGNGRTEYKRKA